MSSKPLVLSPAFDFDHVDFSKDSDVHMDVVITAPQKDMGKRIPLQLILAIDCSGSMAGMKLESVKKTVDKLLKHLTENDTVGIIGFSGSAFEVMPNLSMSQANRSRALDAVKGLKSMTATNIGQALIMAGERAVTAEKDKVSRIVLLTDGLPSAGVCDQEGIINLMLKMNPSVSVSTFGYGNDYDPELLISMSKTGKGNHFYIQKDTDCDPAFALELGGLLSLYAQNIKVVLTPSGTMTFTEFLSDYTVVEKGGFRGLTAPKMIFTIDDIYVGESKHAILKVAIPQATEAVCARATRVCDVEIEYLDTDSKETVTVQGSAMINYVKAGKAGTNPNTEVQKQLIMLEAAKRQKEAMDLANAGKFDQAQVILGESLTWARQQVPLYDNAVHIVSNFQNLADNFRDRNSYRTKGVRMARSYNSAYTRNRATSSDIGTMSMVYTSDVQMETMSSFSSPVSEVKTETSTSGTVGQSDPNQSV